MSDVKRYTMVGPDWEAAPDATGKWVRASDFDADQSDRAALREELAEWKDTLKFNEKCWSEERGTMIDKNQDLQQRLAAAEQRNSDLIDLIQKAHTWVDRNNCGGWDAYELRDELAAAMNKPTESGASE